MLGCLWLLFLASEKLNYFKMLTIPTVTVRIKLNTFLDIGVFPFLGQHFGLLNSFIIKLIHIQTSFHPLESRKTQTRWEINSIQFTVKKMGNQDSGRGVQAEQLENWEKREMCGKWVRMG